MNNDDQNPKNFIESIVMFAQQIKEWQTQSSQNFWSLSEKINKLENQIKQNNDRIDALSNRILDLQTDIREVLEKKSKS